MIGDFRRRVAIILTKPMTPKEMEDFLSGLRLLGYGEVDGLIVSVNVSKDEARKALGVIQEFDPDACLEITYQEDPNQLRLNI